MQKRRPNIDQLLREAIAPRTFTNLKGTTQQLESTLRLQSSGLREHKIVFKEAHCLQASELIDFTKVIMLEGLDAFVGANSGVLKGLYLNKSTFVNYRATLPIKATPVDEPTEGTSSENLDEKHNLMVGAMNTAPITAMCFTGQDQTELLIGRKDGQVELFNSLTETRNSLFTLPGQNEWIKGIQSIKNERILTACASGNLAIWNASGQRQSSEGWTAGENLLTMRLAPVETASVFATGGNENPLKLWDIEEQKCTFTAKNVRPDNLELRVPVWVMNCRFMDGEHCIATSTGKAQIRLYDVRAQRRPVMQESWMEEPIQALSTCSRDWHVLAGNNLGELGAFDLRSSNKSRLVSKYKGFSGAIKCIDAHPSEPQFLSCGIDRSAIVHNLDTRMVVRKIYCKVQLNCCCLGADNSLLLPNQQKRSKGSRKRRNDSQ